MKTTKTNPEMSFAWAWGAAIAGNALAILVAIFVYATPGPHNLQRVVIAFADGGWGANFAVRWTLRGHFSLRDLITHLIGLAISVAVIHLTP